MNSSDSDFYICSAGIILYETPQLRKYLLEHVQKKQQEPDKRRTEYIYIKYHIYRESMRKLQQKQEDEKKWISVIINPIGKWWKSAKHSVAWRLLNIAQTGSQTERLKAVQQLVCMDHLKDWDFRHLAQICDARTSVSLARSGADNRWFVPVPRRGCIKNPKFLLSDLHMMLSRLRPLYCVDHFFSKYFPEQRDTVSKRMKSKRKKLIELLHFRRASMNSYRQINPSFYRHKTLTY